MPVLGWERKESGFQCWMAVLAFHPRVVSVPRTLGEEKNGSILQILTNAAVCRKLSVGRSQWRKQKAPMLPPEPAGAGKCGERGGGLVLPRVPWEQSLQDGGCTQWRRKGWTSALENNLVLCSRPCRVSEVYHNRWKKKKKTELRWYQLSWKLKGLPFKFTIFIPTFFPKFTEIT